MTRLTELYKKTNGGHTLLNDADFEEYSQLRKEEYQTRRDELIKSGAVEVKVCKDDTGDIIGWTWVTPFEKVNL